VDQDEASRREAAAAVLKLPINQHRHRAVVQNVTSPGSDYDQLVKFMSVSV